VEIADVLVAALGDVDDRPLPVLGRQSAQAAEDSSSPAADGDKPDGTLVDLGQLRVGDQLGVKVQPLRVVAGDGVPELDETNQLPGLVGAREVGVSVAQNAAFRLVGEEGEDARASLAPQRQVVVLQGFRLASVGDGVEVQAKGLGLREQQRCQPSDPAGQKPLLLRALGAVGVVGGIALLGQDVEAGEQPQGLIEIEVTDVATTLLVEQL